MKLIKSILIFFTLLFTFQSVFAQEINQWRGKNRGGIYHETGLLKQWPDSGPKMLWSITGLGKGFSSATVSKDAVYISGMIDSSDYLTKLNLKGEQLWQISYGGIWYKTFPDTRSTPTVENGKIYVISGNGVLARIDSKKGDIDWSFNAFNKFIGAYGEWGICESPLIVDNKIIYTPAGQETTIVALNKETGETIWKSESINDTTSYVSPILIERGGKKIIVQVLAKHIIGVDADNGNILWKKNYSEINPQESIKIWPQAPQTNTNSPLYNNGMLYITSGYNHTGVMFKLSEDGKDATQMWADSVLDIHHGGAVLVNGFIYGSNWLNNRKGNWCCIDWNTGEKKYETEWETKGSIISADGLLFCYEERAGNIALVKANPEKFELSGSFKTPLGTGPYWSHLVIDKGVMYVRHGDALMAYQIK